MCSMVCWRSLPGEEVVDRLLAPAAGDQMPPYAPLASGLTHLAQESAEAAAQGRSGDIAVAASLDVDPDLPHQRVPPS